MTMTVRRYRDDGKVAVLQEESVHAAEAAKESEAVSTYAGPADVARGWVRWAQAAVAFGLLVVESALAFRLSFALTGANAANGFVNFIYDVTGPLVRPFENIVNEQASGDGVFEPETVIAMAVYAVAALLIIAFMGLMASAPAPHTEVVTRERHAHYDGHA
jgi:hypothetical protein